MAVREDLIEGAVSFLQDPSVSAAPVEQRVAFLRSKNLTQEEIDASLARVGQATPTQAVQSSYTPQAQYQQRPPQYGYPQQQQPYWPQQPPPELPRRDWRDYFIMATITAGLGTALYWTAKRYIVPLIAPPTPPQLEQDKASIDQSFEKAFSLLEQLATDTQELKESEKQRTERLDLALSEVESVIAKMKEANESRELEGKRMANEVREIKDQIPRAIEKEREGTENRLKELSLEMKSLKTLVANRMAGPQRATPSPSSFSSQIPSSAANGIAPGAAPEMNGAPAVNGTPAANGGAEEEQKASVLPERSASASPYGNRMLNGQARIPAWQLAAKKKSEEAKKEEEKSTAESGTVTEVEAGA